MVETGLPLGSRKSNGRLCIFFPLCGAHLSFIFESLTATAAVFLGQPRQVTADDLFGCWRWCEVVIQGEGNEVDG